MVVGVSKSFCKMNPFPDAYDHPAQAVCISGMKGSGKTTEFLRRLKNWKTKHGKIPKWKFVFDPEREVSIRLGWPVCTTIEQMENRVAKCQPVCFDPSELFGCDTPEETAEALAFFSRWVWNLAPYLNGIKLFCVDEVQDCTTIYSNGVPLYLKKIIHKGRRKRIDFLCIVNGGLNNLNEQLKAQITDYVVFQTTSQNALDDLKDKFSKEQLEQIRELKLGKYLTA